MKVNVAKYFLLMLKVILNQAHILLMPPHSRMRLCLKFGIPGSKFGRTRHKVNELLLCFIPTYSYFQILKQTSVSGNFRHTTCQM